MMIWDIFIFTVNLDAPSNFLGGISYANASYPSSTVCVNLFCIYISTGVVVKIEMH